MTRPARRRPLAISAPSMELNDIHATRSPSWHPSEVKALATRLARLLRVAKSWTRSAQMTAGLSASAPAWSARKSRPTDLILGVAGARRKRGRGLRRAQSVAGETKSERRWRHAPRDHHAVAVAASEHCPRVGRGPVMKHHRCIHRRVLRQRVWLRVCDRFAGGGLRRIEL